ncbi:hypothetical protein CVT26_004278 [Gymnopilus dilepis]|uniref:BHLH domain-containing protein n=1 Tax=Gymnopilus dilepis TaxID=231916 RepID=A0A409YVG7_9AGAR|nr:hypothetical protein CVT26_004278 [Gymnopilus dilepis]
MTESHGRVMHVTEGNEDATSRVRVNHHSTSLHSRRRSYGCTPNSSAQEEAFSQNTRTMSLERRKGSSTRVELAASKGNLKQKTLFDSFVVKSIAKSNIAPQDAVPSDTSSTFPSGANTTVSGSPASTRPNSITGSLKSEFAQEAVPCVDLTCDENVESGQHTLDKSDSDPRRSPSITIVDIDQVTDDARSTTGDAALREKYTKPEGHSQERPIVVDSSPIKVASVTSKPLYPLFASKVKPATPSSRPLQPVRKQKDSSVTLAAPFPTGVSQHVRGPQTPFQIPGLQLPRKASRQTQETIEASWNFSILKENDIVEDESMEPSKYRRDNTPKEPSSNEIPVEHTSAHPAIARLVNGDLETSPTSRRPWSDKWRPLSAQEVLGNERSAIYLRNWLRALELQLEDNTGIPPETKVNHDANKQVKKGSMRGTKRPRVVRAVTKSRKRSRIDSEDEDDSWIVYDDESEQETLHDEEIDDIVAEVPASSESSAAPEASSLVTGNENLGQLHNTILLSGPSGSGKTACVYACAEELGWDVFEVYPGVGRRNGANVDNLIGEVGKNHLVLQSRSSGDAMKAFLSRKKTTNATDDVASPSVDDLRLTYSPRKRPQSKDTPEPGETVNGARPIRQSLILLEEVDILYREDANFWATVTRIIQDCKRPVICTCNDISLVPIGDLPLQTIIEFAPCPTDVATSYLQALCTAEGYSINRDAISQLYEGQLIPAPILQRAPKKPDLRRTINELQIQCPALSRSHAIASDGTVAHSRSEAEDAPAVGKFSMKKYEFLSYFDSNVVTDPSVTFKDTELASYLPSEDDEMGHPILYDVYAKDGAQFGQYDRQEDMIFTAIEISSGLLDREMLEKEDEWRKQHREVIEELLPVGMWRRGCLEHCVDYLPYVRQMVEAEDAEEAREARRVGRRTRNSIRSGYVRMISMTEEARKKLEWTPSHRSSPMSTVHPRDTPSRHSPVASLASLEFLQNQRRGSITDPSLHAAPVHQPSPSSPHSSSRPYLPDPRPSSPFVFGDATVESSSHLRKLLHSPAPEHRPPPPLSHDSQASSRNHSGTKDMNAEGDRYFSLSRRGIREPPAFDFNMRRHSIAVGQNPITLPNLSSTLHGPNQGTKRKMSADRNAFAPVGEDVDPQLVGPGVPSVMDVDVDAPAPKRRGSTIDMQRIAQLSINDRRNSVDSRGGQWPLPDRRDSAPSLFPGINSFNSPLNPPDSQHNRVPSSMASFSWPTNSQSTDTSTSSVQNESNHNTRPFDPVHQMNMVPPVNYPPDRRMSVPDNLTHPNSSKNTHTRSRPPSRQGTDANSHSGLSSGQEEQAPPSSTKPAKEPGSTPYSRSPELRVSHKLAERKRRKEMKDLFDELRDQLPADRGMKASKWEILSKAIDFVTQLKRSHQEMAAELEMLRAQVHGQRSEGIPYPPPSHPPYSQPMLNPFPPPLLQPLQTPGQNSDSRTNSTQNLFPPPHGTSNQNGHRADPS